MTSGTNKTIPDRMPEDVWTALQDQKDTALVDCRTVQEWQGIGHPDLGKIGKTTHLVEWKQAPAMAVNPEFVAQLDQALDGEYPATLFFICRSGVRSKEAATLIQEILSSKSIACECVNVAEGFEGKPSDAGPTGWRDKNLPSKTT